MARLDSVKRLYCLKDIKAGMTNAELIEKYGVTASALTYLRQKSVGITPAMTEFKERIGAYSEERIIRLFKQGDEVGALAKDYECSTALMRDFLELVYPLSSRPKTSKRIVLPKNRRK